MDNEQVVDTSIQDTSAPVEAETNTTITMTEAELNKKLQSASSKAKNDIMKELGINSIKDFQDLKATYETAVNDKNILEENIKTLNQEKTKLSEDLMLTKLGVSEEYRDDLLTLAKSKVDNAHTLEDVSKSLLEKFPQFKSTKEQIKMGTEKANIKDTVIPPTDSDLVRRFPWLK